MIKKSSDEGFTLVELLMAMAFFSFILLFITTGFLIVGRAYNKGITVKLVQDEGRRVMEQLTRDMRTASSINTSDLECIAINETIYYWSVPIDDTNSASPKFLLREDNKSCSSRTNNPAASGVQNVLHERLGVQDMKITEMGGKFYKIELVLSTNETILIDLTNAIAKCDESVSGSQYCDVVDFTTIVSTR